ncbi:MAG: DMT family transporter [Rhodospirillales bacterium]|nr:DMT family transporter [Rhodospirillales bacterium]MDP6882775.1 DMT family transporter [Rhodospirillales bacterium]
MSAKQPDADQRRLPRLGLFLLFAVALGWGVNWPIMKVALNEISPWTFRAYSLPASGLVLLVVARLSGLTLRVPRRLWPYFAVVTVFHVTLWYILIAYGVAYLGASRSVLLAFTVPLWSTVFALFILREPLTPQRLAALALGMAGIGALMWGDIEAAGISPIGAALTLVGAISWGLAIVLLKRVDWEMPVITLTGWQVFIGALPLVAIALIKDPVFQPLSAGALGSVLYNIFIAGALCTYGWYKIISLFPANVSALGTLMIPVVGVISGHVMLGEPIGLRELTAMIFICSALALALFTPAPPPGRPAAR